MEEKREKKARKREERLQRKEEEKKEREVSELFRERERPRDRKRVILFLVCGLFILERRAAAPRASRGKDPAKERGQREKAKDSFL